MEQVTLKETGTKRDRLAFLRGLAAATALALTGCASAPARPEAAVSAAAGGGPTLGVDFSPIGSVLDAPRTEAAAAVSAAAGGVSLDAAIAQAAERMEARLPAGSKVALISVSSPSQTFSKYVLDRLESVLVNNGKLVVVDRANLDKVREEQGFQMSGEVSDESAKAIGKLIGADAIVTGSLVSLGSLYQLTLKAINMESAVVAASHQADIRNDERVRALLGQTGVAAGSAAGSAAASGSGKAAAPAQSAAATSAAAPAKPAEPVALGALYAGEVLQGEMDLLDALDWIALNAQSGGKYTIALGKDEAITPTELNYGGKAVTITLKSAGGARMVTFEGQNPAYSLFTVSAGVTFTLENGVTLKGSQNNAGQSLVVVAGGKFIMNGGAITENRGGYGGGVYVKSGSFTMNGGIISKNTVNGKGGGVYVASGSFIMNDGTINGNNSSPPSGGYDGDGGGVCVASGTFTMNGGIISGNTCGNTFSLGYGGGVYVSGSFTMNNGTISGNTASLRGGGVCVSGTFTMGGGTISGNTAGTWGGGGVYTDTFIMKGGTISLNTSKGSGGGVYANKSFTKVGTAGIIYGSNAADGNGNTASSDADGHAVYVNGIGKRNTTARAATAMDSSKDGPAGGWE